jgi:hypothetical protein
MNGFDIAAAVVTVLCLVVIGAFCLDALIALLHMPRAQREADRLLADLERQRDELRAALRANPRFCPVCGHTPGWVKNCARCSPKPSPAPTRNSSTWRLSDWSPGPRDRPRCGYLVASNSRKPPHKEPPPGHRLASVTSMQVAEGAWMHEYAFRPE